jgi:hypothetical protein
MFLLSCIRYKLINKNVNERLPTFYKIKMIIYHLDHDEQIVFKLDKCKYL